MIMKQEVESLYPGFVKLQKAVYELATRYVSEFGSGRDPSITNITFGYDVDGDEIKDRIIIETQEYYRGDTDYESYNIPVSYLWDDSWIIVEETKRQEERLAQLRKIEEQKIEVETQARERRLRQYETLKKEFENVVE